MLVPAAMAASVCICWNLLPDKVLDRSMCCGVGQEMGIFIKRWASSGGFANMMELAMTKSLWVCGWG